MKKYLYVVISIAFLMASALANEWRDVTYVSHINFKMKVEVFPRPLVLEWGKVPNETPSEEVAEKLRCVASKGNISVLGLSFEEWEKYCTEDYVTALRMDLDKFNKIKEIDVINKYPRMKYESVLYMINYQIDGCEYCLVVSHTSSSALTKMPENLAEFDRKNPISGSLLKKEENIWKAHVFDKIPYDGIRQFKNLDELLRIEREGFAVNGIETPYIYGFSASDELRKAVGRKK